MPRRIRVDYDLFSKFCPDPKTTEQNAPKELAQFAQLAKICDATDEDVEHAKASAGWGYLGSWIVDGRRVLCLEEDGTLVGEGRVVDMPPIAESASCG